MHESIDNAIMWFISNHNINMSQYSLYYVFEGSGLLLRRLDYITSPSYPCTKSVRTFNVYMLIVFILHTVGKD
jgi:hypothetical protein